MADLLLANGLNALLSFFLSPILLGALAFVFIAIAWYYRMLLAPSQAPYIKSLLLWHGMPKSYSQYMEYGYQKFKDRMFSVPTDSGPLLILPHKFVDEIKALPDTKASFRKSFEFWFLNAHTNIGGDAEHQMALINAAKRHLTKHKDLEQVLSAMQEELDYAFETELPSCDDWADVKLYPVMIRIVARIIARVFVGVDLCRNEQYLDISIKYTVHCLEVSRILAWCPPPLRPIVKLAVPGYLTLRRQEKRMQELLTPIIDKRLLAMKSGDKTKKPADLLQWFIDDAPEGKMSDHKYLSLSQVTASLGAIHSVSPCCPKVMFEC